MRNEGRGLSDMEKMNAILVGCLAVCVRAGEHPVEEATGRLRLLRWLVLVDR